MSRDLATQNSSEIWTQAADEIKRLHTDIIGHARQSLETAIRIGEILSQVRSVLKHGQWQGWIEDNLPFTYRTAHRYVSIYDRRDQIKNDNLSLFGEAYALLESPNGSSSQPQQLHESNFWTRNVKMGQTYFGFINRELKDHPIETWRKDQVVTMAATLEPYANLYQRLKSLI